VIALSTGILDETRVGRTVARLFEDDLFSGWGVRTLSSRHAAYDPFSYQRGSVWPVEQGALALALARYGLNDRVDRLARSQFELAALYEFHRLPELVAGHPRDDEHPFPGVYRDANWPQAWSASSVFCLIQAMIGLYPYAPLRLLLLDPHLPAWLPELTLQGLSVGEAEVDLRFRRDATGARPATRSSTCGGPSTSCASRAPGRSPQARGSACARR
jgi:glycogen debranching enzyme